MAKKENSAKMFHKDVEKSKEFWKDFNQITQQIENIFRSELPRHQFLDDNRGIKQRRFNVF